MVGSMALVVWYRRPYSVGLWGVVFAGPAVLSLGVVGPVLLWARSGVGNVAVPVSLVVGVPVSSR